MITSANFFQHIKDNFQLIDNPGNTTEKYMVEVKNPKTFKSPGKYLRETAESLKLKDLQVDYVDGLSPKAKQFSGPSGHADFSLCGRAYSPRDHSYLYRCLSGHHGHRGSQRTGAVYASGGGLYYVLPDLCHFPGQGRTDQTPGNSVKKAGDSVTKSPLSSPSV